MKNLTTNLLIAAAAFVAVAGTASAQAKEAKIPFAFRASGKVLPAGAYRVSMRSTASGIKELIVSTASGKNEVLTYAAPAGPAKAAWTESGMAVLSFQCGVSRCALKDAWMGGSDQVYEIAVPKLGRDEPVHTAEIVLHNVKGD